jgi:hypothetical protein
VTVFFECHPLVECLYDTLPTSEEGVGCRSSMVPCEDSGVAAASVPVCALWMSLVTLKVSCLPT